MAADLAGTAAIRLVPSLTGFRARAQTELQRQKGLSVDVDIRPQVNTSIAKKQLEKFRAKEQADAINLKARVDEAEFKRSFQRVEHVFQRSAFAKALRLQIKVVGLDALYALSAAGAAAAASIDTVAKAAVILPGALAAAGVAAGVFAVALKDVGKAITQIQTEQDQAADKARALEGAMADGARASRDVQRAHTDVARATQGIGRAARQAIRDFEDLAHAVRGTSLDEADALLNVQESYDRLAAGGFESLTELRRAQVGYARDLHALDGVRNQNKRTLEDFNEAQRQGLAGNEQVIAAQDKLVSALDGVEDANNRVADAARRMADATQTKTMGGAYARLAPAAKEFADEVARADSAWVKFTGGMQQGVFEGQAKNLRDTLGALESLQPALGGVASQIGGVFKDLGAIIRRDDIRGMLDGIVTGTGNTIGTIRQGLDPLISGFLRMAEVGVRHLPQLVDVFNRLWERFDAFTARAAADGTLDRWIQNGITGFEQLLLTGENILVTISAVAQAWRAAGGEQTGLIQNAADLTTEIRQWATGAEGQNSMITQFRNMREWLGDMKDALANIWPAVQQIVATIREWSAAFLAVLGPAFQLTSWIESHTGLVSKLVAVYLTIKTVTPIWHALTAAATMYQNALLKNAAMGREWAMNSVNGLATVQDRMGKTGTAAQTLAGTFGSTSKDIERSTKGWSNIFTNAVNTAGADMDRLRQGAGQTATSMTTMGTNATTAGNNVGTMGEKAKGAAGNVGSRTSGLWGAAAGLGAMLGPMAVAMLATGGIIWAIDKMGEAHRRAAAEAENQKNQLANLRTTLDSFTGAFTAQTAIQAGKDIQDFQTTGFGKRNVGQDIARTGVGTAQGLIAATNPVNQAQRDQFTQQLTSGALERLAPALDKEMTGPGGVPTSRRKRYEAAGLSDRDLVGVLTGDPAATAKWNDAVSRQPGGPNAPGAIPNASQMVLTAQKDIPPEAWDYLTSLQFLNTNAASNVAGGQQNQATSAGAFGTGVVRPGADPGGQFFGSNPRVTMTGIDTATIESSESMASEQAALEFVKNFPSDVGAASVLPGNRIQITLTREGFNRYIEKKATGGMIRGVGSGTSDSNIIAASRGEYIIRKAAVDAIGVHNLDRMNMGRFDIGGMPFPLKPPSVPPPPINPTAPPVVPDPYAPTVPAAPAPAPAVPAAPATPALPSVPSSYPALPAPTTSMPYSPSATPGSGPMTGITGPMGPLGPVSVNQNSEQGPILDYLTQITQQAGLRVGSSVRDEPGSWHHTGNALDIGNGADAIPLAQWWIQDPARVANTKELILSGPGWDPMMNIKDGKFIRDYGGGVYDADTLAGHADHLHLALGGVPIGGMPSYSVNGQTVAYDPYNPTVQYGSGASGVPGGTLDTQKNLPLGERIANMYANALKPENVNKFLLGQVENVGQSLMAIGTSFLKGFTGIDIGAIYSPAQQIISHYTGAGQGDSGGSQSTLQAGSPMDQQITGGLNSFFDPNAGVNIAGIAGSVGGTAHGSPSAGIPGPGPQGILQYIVQKAMSLGYSKQQAIWFATQAFGESGLNPGANGGNQDGTGDVMGIFQFTPGTWGSRPGSPSDATRNIDEYFNLAKERGLTPQTFVDPTQLGTQVSKGGPYHPSNVGHRERAEAGVAPLLSALGFASGGFVPARVSRGEYRMSPKAVAHYGVGFMNRVNSLGGFDEGGTPWADPSMPGYQDPATVRQNPLYGGGTANGWYDKFPQAAHGWVPARMNPFVGSNRSFSEQNIWGQHPMGFARGGIAAPEDTRGQLQQPTTGSPINSIMGGVSEGLSIGAGYAQQAMAEHGIQLPGFAAGGLPAGMIKPVIPAPRPTIQAQPKIAPKPAPAPARPSVPKAPGAQPKSPVGAPHRGTGSPAGPSPAPGVPAPTPGPGTPPPVGAPASDRSLSMVPGAPTRSSSEGYINPAISRAFEEGWNHAGALGAMAASSGMGGAGIPGGGAAGMAIQGGAAIIGKWAGGVANLVGAAMIGNVAEIGTQPTPSGTPLLPAIAPRSFSPLQTPDQVEMQQSHMQARGGQGGPLIMNVYNGGIHTNNMDEWNRRRQLLERQQEQPLTNTFAK